MQILVQGTPTPLLGKEVHIGKEAPAARINRLDGSQNVIGMIAPTVQILLAFPSLKTQTCAQGATKLNEIVKRFGKKVSGLLVTTDTLEWLNDFVQTTALDSLDIVVDSDKQFGKKYGLLIDGGKLGGRLARAVFVIDKEGIIIYKEVVNEISDELDYDALMHAVDTLLSQKKKEYTHENWMSV